MSRGISLIIVWLFTMLSTFPLQAAEKLVIYSGRSEKFIKPVLAEFTKTSGIETILHTGRAAALLNQLKLEGNRTEADIFISNDAGTLQRGAAKKLFTHLPATITDPIPKNYRDANDSWVGLSARARVLVINTQDKDSEFVKSVMDLADPRLKGKLAITVSNNGSFIAGVSVYLDQLGSDKVKAWLLGTKKNIGTKAYNKHSSIVKAVASGKKSVGLVNHYYIYHHLNNHPSSPIKILLPDQLDTAEQVAMGVAWNVAGAAISRYSKKKKAAVKFMAFVTSPAGQKIFSEFNYEYPTRSGVTAAKMIPAIGTFKIASTPMSKLGVLRNVTLKLIESVGLP